MSVIQNQTPSVKNLINKPMSGFQTTTNFTRPSSMVRKRISEARNFRSTTNTNFIQTKKNSKTHLKPFIFTRPGDGKISFLDDPEFE